MGALQSVLRSLRQPLVVLHLLVHLGLGYVVVLHDHALVQRNQIEDLQLLSKDTDGSPLHHLQTMFQGRSASIQRFHGRMQGQLVHSIRDICLRQHDVFRYLGAGALHRCRPVAGITS